MRKINFFAEETDFILPQPAATANWLQQVVQQENHTIAQLNVIFCSDRYLHAYHLQYLQQDTLTDVLTFDYSEQPKTLDGEVYISIDRVKENALLIRQQPWLQEVYTVLVHGVLHLLGYKDDSPAAQTLMRQKEAVYTNQASFLREEPS